MPRLSDERLADAIANDNWTVPVVHGALLDLREARESAAAAVKERDELRAELQRVQIEIVGSLTSVGVYMLAEKSCGYGEITFAVQRLASERDTAMKANHRYRELTEQMTANWNSGNDGWWSALTGLRMLSSAALAAQPEAK